MRIDFIVYAMEAGGAQRVVSLLANYLAEKKYKVRIITFRGKDKYELNKEIKRIKLHKMPIIDSVILNGFFSLLLYYRKKNNRPDIISSHVNLMGYVSIPIAKIYNLKIIVSEHNNHLARESFSKKLLWKYLYPLPNTVTILTKFDLNFFKKRNKNIVLMPNPCSFTPIEIDKINTKRKKEIIAIGDLDRYDAKGFDNLIDIASKTLKNNSEWTIKIIGEGSAGFKVLNEKVKSHNLEEKVIFTGYRKDIRKILATSEIFILSSRYEGLPMVLIEAMSQGATCIAYNCVSGPSDIITHNVNGILVENQNKEKMILELKKIIENDTLRNKLRSKSPKSIDKFSIENVGKKWEELIHKTLRSEL